MTEAHGPRGLTDRSKTGRLFDRIAQARPVPGNAVTLYHDAPLALEAMLDLIASARHWIHFDNYIIRDDRIGTRFAEALMARARDGLAVRVMTDWLGSIGTSRGYWARLRQAGVEVRRFNPPRLAHPVSFLSRNHRKLVVVDGARAITGGICIGDEWMGNPGGGVLPWRDSAVRIDGPAAAVLDQAFGKVWARSGDPLPDGELPVEVAPAGSAEVRVLAGEPGRSRMEGLFALVLAGATDRIWVTDAYMVAPRRLAAAMVDAARDGVDVRLLVPGTSDLPYVRNLTRIGYRDLLAAGVRIFEWGGPMLHAKSTVTDGRWVRIGSTNLNWSSLVSNWELDVVIEHPDLAGEMEAAFRRDLGQSAEVQSRPLRAPLPLQRILPPALAIAAPDQPLPPHARGRRERRRQRLVTLLTVVTSAQRALFGTAALVMFVLAVLAWLVPRAVGLTFGALSLLVAALALRGMMRRRREVPPPT